MTEEEFFYRLTPDIVMQAVESAGFHPSGHWLQLNSMENRVFSIALERSIDGLSHAVVKFYRPGRWNFHQISDEHRFLFTLHRAEIPVCIPLELANALPPTDSGVPATVAVTEGIYYAVWPRTGGRMPEEFDLEQMHRLGRLLGRIHRTGLNFSAPDRPEFSGETRILRPLTFLLENGFLPAHCRERYRSTALAMHELCSRYIDPLPRLAIHGDCHPGNLLIDQDRYFFLDFDDFVIGPAVQDFWMLFRFRGKDNQQQQQAFLSGYRTFADAEESWLRCIELLRGIRYISYAAWIAGRWEDPAFRALLPHFGTDAYWEQETVDLEQQLFTVRDALDCRLQPETGAEELTNSDFFWDME